MQKLSIIRFEPKPSCLDEFAANLTSFNETKHHVFHLMQSGDELHAIVIRNAEILTQDAADGVNWLDGHGIFFRSLTQRINIQYH